MGKSITIQNSDLQKIKILWVDDDKSIVELGRAWLDLLGYEARTAFNGQEALDLLKKDFCPIIITDLQMPVMNGYELIQEIRRNYGQKCFIIAVSGSQKHLDVVDAFSLANVAIVKPFSLDSLKLTIEKNQ